MSAVVDHEKNARKTRVRRRPTDRELGREVVDLLLSRAVYLPAVYRELVAARYELNLPVSRLARLHRVSGREMRCRLDAIRRSLLAPEFALFVRYHDHLQNEQRQAARLIYIHGNSYRSAAQILGLSVHRVRTLMADVQERLRALLLLEQHRARESSNPVPMEGS